MNASLTRVEQLRAIVGRKDLAQADSDRAQPRGVEGGQLELGLADAGEATLFEEADAVVQWREAGNAVARVEEVGGTREQPQEAVVRAGRVGDLADAIERLVARVLAHAQDRLGLVDDDHQALVTGGLDDLDGAAEVESASRLPMSPLIRRFFWRRHRRCRCRRATR
jgi:hypothetical protein